MIYISLILVIISIFISFILNLSIKDLYKENKRLKKKIDILQSDLDNFNLQDLKNEYAMRNKYLKLSRHIRDIEEYLTKPRY